MSITEQIAILNQIKRTLQKELTRIEDKDVKTDIQAELDGLDWSIKTLQEVRLMRQSIKYLLEVG